MLWSPQADLKVGATHEPDLKVGTTHEPSQADLKVGATHEPDLKVGTTHELKRGATRRTRSSNSACWRSLPF
jgi:hypothetical protein